MVFPEAEVRDIQRLLLNPTAANFDAANAKLESIASFVLSAKKTIESGKPYDPSLQIFLTDLRQEMARIRNLLEGAAKFFNSLNSLRDSPAYQRNGFLRAESRGRRTVVQL